MRVFAFTVTTYDAARPWVVASRDHRTVQLPDDVDFAAWARDTYPGDATTVELDPQAQSPWPRD